MNKKEKENLIKIHKKIDEALDRLEHTIEISEPAGDYKVGQLHGLNHARNIINKKLRWELWILKKQ